jgi:putative ATP-binding cassette transporter
MVMLSALVTAATFFGILWSISSWLAVFLVGYAAVGTWLTVIIARRLVLINFDQQRYEADYRFALVHARDNAEQVALYQGTRDEARQLSSRFARVLRNFKLLILWQRHLTFFTEAYDDAANLVPYLVLAVAYFSGHFKLGEFTQAASPEECLKPESAWRREVNSNCRYRSVNGQTTASNTLINPTKRATNAQTRDSRLPRQLIG